MRVEQVSGSFQRVGQDRTDPVVAVPCAADVGPDRVDRLAVQIQHAHEITRIAHVHRIGQRSDRRPRHVNARNQVLQENVVAVVGRDETFYRQSHPFGEQAGRDVAEITARNADYDLPVLPCPAHLRVSVEVVECLRQEAGYVDRIGRSQPETFVQFPIEESAFDQPLAVVERAVDLKGRNVPAERRKLFFLDLADLAFRVEHHDVDALHAEETVGYGAAGIARRGDQHGHPTVVATDKVGQHSGHETGSDVFECQSRPVKQFERINSRFDPDDRRFETQRIADDLSQRFMLDVVSEKRLRYTAGDLVERHGCDSVVKRTGQFFNSFGHVESLVGSQAADDRFAERNFRRRMVRAVIFHRFFAFTDGLLAAFRTIFLK